MAVATQLSSNHAETEIVVNDAAALTSATGTSFAVKNSCWYLTLVCQPVRGFQIAGMDRLEKES